VSARAAFRALGFTPTFLEAFASKEFGAADRRALLKALTLLDTNEQHPSLRVHELRGPLAGLWSASASKSLRMTFMRSPHGTKVMMTCTHDYGD
jgi:mRNA-degrading endonuclease YafQ of YafQ-DinJ toxin-antitoxin module